jgi:type 1 fimbriae regulatory protein FimB/type 1 fimbriae regulatory protein FimE
MLRKLRRDYPDLPFVFVTERGGPMTPANVRKMLTRAGDGLGIAVRPHMLRHGCGFRLANRGIDTRSIQAYMGHSSISSTVIYTDIAPERFKGFWKD